MLQSPQTSRYSHNQSTISLFREFIAQLEVFNKSFIVIGHQNAITYKEIFKLIKENKLWLGYGFKGNVAYFINHNYINYAKSGNHKEYMIRVSGVKWFTNLPIQKLHKILTLSKTYNLIDYPKYDHYDAINVNKTKDIPKDYPHPMGVPLTFMDKYNPTQFEIIDALNRYSVLQGKTEETKGKYLQQINGKPLISESSSNINKPTNSHIYLSKSEQHGGLYHNL